MQPVFTDLQHPTPDQLRSFTAGLLTATDMAIVRNHLRICPECQNTIQQLEQNSSSASETHNQNDSSDVTKPILTLEKDAGPALPLPVSLANHPRYTILELLGTGGMGTVYRAMDRHTGNYVAIKVLQIHDPQSLGRFQREIELLRKLNHPNLVAIHDASLAGDQPYIVMECIEGISLDRLMTRRGLFRIADACEIVRQVAEGLDHAHARAVVHRDVKPSNIMLTPQGKVKLLDWGLARALENHTSMEIFITAANQIVGTPDYIAPEQLEDSRQVDNRADVYSLGGTLFMLLTGMPPRNWQAGSQKQYGWLERPDQTIASIRQDVKTPLRRAIADMLELNPVQRIASAGEVATLLASFTAGADLNRLMGGDDAYSAVERPSLLWDRIFVWLSIVLLFAVTLYVIFAKRG